MVLASLYPSAVNMEQPMSIQHPTRTIALRVAEIIKGGSKQEFYADLRATLDYSRRIYNAGLTESAAQDTESFTVDGTIPKKTKIATYATLVKGKSFASGFTSETSNILRAAETKYKECRFDLLRGVQSLPLSRSHPWPLLHNNGSTRISVEYLSGNIYVTLRLMHSQWNVRMKSGSNYRDQIAGVAKYEIGDSRIWRDRKGVAVIGFAVKVPPTIEPPDPGKKMIVRTMPDALLCTVRSRSATPYVHSGELVKQRVDIRNGLQRKLRQDIKPGAKRQVRRKLASNGKAWKRWVGTYIHELTASIVNFAVRNQYGVIELDDAVRSFLPSFPWYDLKSKLEYKCEDRGIEFKHNPTIAFELCEPFIDPTPHVYFAAEIDRNSGDSTGRVKIGKTTQATHKRLDAIGGQTNLGYVPIAVYESKKSRLTKDEKMFHALFADHRIAKDRELFTLGPVETWLRERGAIESPMDSVAISRPKDSGLSDDSLRSNSSVRGNADLKCDCNGDIAEGVATRSLT